jgi:cytochrome oxidase Cu insertion factor (SCO1/SenC/PrrC family)
MRRTTPALLALAACASSTPPTPLPEGRVALRLIRTDGTPFNLASVRGKVAIVSVFSTSSDPALVELKLYEDLKRRHGDDLEVVCAVVETDLRMVEIFEQTFRVPFTIGMVEDPRVFTSDRGPFGPITVDPTSVLLDADGRIAARMDGLWPPGVLADAVGALVEKVADRSGRL